MTQFPDSGISKEKIFQTLDDYRKDDGDYKGGKTWSLVYYAGEDITRLTQEVYRKFFHANGLNPFVFQSLKRLETETLSMAADLFHGDGNVAGSLTSGGSESILMAVKNLRDEARALKIPHYSAGSDSPRQRTRRVRESRPLFRGQAYPRAA